MNKTLLSIILSILFFTSQAQHVSTLVTGPANFNDGLVQDSLGNIYASYYFGTVVTKITPSGQTSNYVSGLTDPNGLTLTPEGLLLIPEATANRITLVDTGGNKSTFANITNPSGLVFLPSGDLLVAQYNQDKVSIIDTAGNISDFWTGTELSGGPVGIAYNAQEKATYVGTFDNAKILKRDSMGNVTQLADLAGWCGFICEAGDYIYATAYSFHRIFRIAKDGSGNMSIAGNGSSGQVDGDLSQARFDNPNGIIASKNGDTLYISDLGTRSLRVISGLDSIITPSSLENKLEIPGMAVWPNPARDFLNLYVPIIEGDYQLEIYDLNSNLVYSYNYLRNTVIDNTIKINLPSELKAGKYHLKVNSKSGTEVLSFMIR